MGLNPYSAISFFRSSSASFRAFLFLHRKKPIKNAAAMTTMGMMTAIAILPPELSPPEDFELDPEALSADGVDDDYDVLVVSTVDVSDAVVGEYIDVTTTTVGGKVLPSVDEGVSVIVAVTATTLGLEDVVEATTTVVEGGIDTEETIVEGVVTGVVVTTGVVEELSVTVTVVVGDVVRLMAVVVLSVVRTESVVDESVAIAESGGVLVS